MKNTEKKLVNELIKELGSLLEKAILGQLSEDEIMFIKLLSISYKPEYNNKELENILKKFILYL